MATYPSLVCLLIHPEFRATDANGKTWRFELHPYCGPFVLNRRGDPLATQPAANSPFWEAFQKWSDEHRPAPDPAVPRLDIIPTPKRT